MTRDRLALAAPPLLAGALVLGIAAHNPGQYRLPDLLGILAAVGLATWLAGLVVLAGVRAFDRSDRALPLAAALTSVGVLVCFYYGPLRSALASVAPLLARQRVLAPVVVIGALVACGWLLRLSYERLRVVTAFLVRFGLVLLALLVVKLLTAQARAPRAVARSALVDSLARPIRVVRSPSPGRNTPPRDIYLIVADGHANAGVLTEMFQYDVSPFQDSLRALGFLVPRDVRSNYVQTYLSVASLLNAAHMTRLTDDAGLTSTDHTLPTYLVKHNRVTRFLKEHGYKYVLFPSAWWGATKDSPLADETFDAESGSSFADVVRRTELRRAVLASTLLHLVVKPEREPTPVAEQIFRSIEGLRRGAGRPRPHVHVRAPPVAACTLPAGCAVPTPRASHRRRYAEGHARATSRLHRPGALRGRAPARRRDRPGPAVLDAARDSRRRRSRLGVFRPGLLRTPRARPPRVHPRALWCLRRVPPAGGRRQPVPRAGDAGERDGPCPAVLFQRRSARERQRHVRVGAGALPFLPGRAGGHALP